MANGNHGRGTNGALRRRMDRRGVLRGLTGGAALAAGGFLITCAGDDQEDAGESASGAATSSAGGAPAAGGGTLNFPEAKRGGVLTVLSASEPPNVDPHLVITVQMVFTTSIYSRLMHYDAGPETLVPELAQAAEQPDPLSYVYRLRQGVKFHNGAELTSEDVRYSFERLGQIGKEKPDPAFAQAWMMADVASIDTPDQYTVVFKTKEPSAVLAGYIGAPFNGIVNKAFTEQKGDLKQDANGTGYWKLREWRRGQEISLERHQDYFWAPLPYLDGYRQLTVPDAATSNAAFEAGRTVGGVQNTLSGGYMRRINELKARIPDIQWVSKMCTFWTYFDFNKTKAPYNDIRVRKAVQLAIDRQDGTDRVDYGEGAPNGPIAAGFPFWPISQEELKQMPGYRYPKDQDLAEARRLLEAAGFGPRNPLKAEHITTPLHPWYYGWTLATKEQLAKVGIELNVKEFPDFGSFLQARAQGNFDTYCYSQGGPDEVDQYLSEPFLSTSPSNFGKYNNPEVDAMLERQRRTLDRTERKKVVDELQRKLLEDVPHAFLATKLGYAFWRPQLHVPKEIVTPSYSAFFGQWHWLDPIPGNMRDFSG